MAQHKYEQKILPKYVDSDSEVRYIKTDAGGVRYMSNIRIGKRNDKQKGAAVKIRGTLLVPNSYLPAGTNECIGSRANESGTFLLFLNWNSNTGHSIFMYNPTFAEPIQLLYKDSPGNEVLGFHRYYRIKGTKAKIVQDQHFFWTDAYNAPRYLNIDWALNYKKKKVFEIQQVDEDTVDFNVLVFKFNGVLTNVFTGNFGTILLSNPLLNDYFDIEDCSCSVILTEKEANTCELNTNSTKLRIVPQNFYTEQHHERQIDLVCYPSSTAPQVILKKDIKQRRNFLAGYTWQFRTKIIYFDGNESAWSSWSKLINTSGNCEEEYNYIAIDYTDKIFDCYNDLRQLNVIKEVVIGYRNTNQGNLHSFVRIKQCDIPKVSQVYNFYNDIYAGLEPEYDDKVKQYDLVPLQCGALSAANNRLITADVTENYEVDCFDFKVDVEYHPNKEIQRFNGKITGYIDILNRMLETGVQNPGTPTNVPIIQTTENANTYFFGRYSNRDGFDQRLGTKGFVAYLVGTDNIAISKQVISPGIDVNIADADFDIVRFVNDADKQKVADVISNNTSAFRQKFEFNGLKDGIYVIRLASHWCSYGDKLGKGEVYDLDNGLTWQKTSTNVYKVNNEVNIFEATVSIIGGVMQGPEPVFTVQDCTDIGQEYIHGGDIPLGYTTSLIQGYVIDSESVTQADVYNGLRIEYATVKMVRTGEFGAIDEKGTPSFAKTDHNGYFYAIAEVNINDIGGNNKILVSKGKDINWNDLIGNDGDMAILWNGDDPYTGNLTQLKNGTCGTFDNSGTGDNFVQQVVNNFITPYLADAHNITNNFRTLVKGKILNQAGIPVPGVLVVALGTNRYDTSDANGEFGIIMYANSKTDSDLRSYTLIFSGDECNNISTIRGGVITLGRFTLKYNNSNPFTIADILSDVIYSDLTPVYYLKNGDTYDIAATLMDRGLRKTTVLHNDKTNRIVLPFTTEYIQDYFPNLTVDTKGNPITATTKAEGFFTLKITLLSKPPIWAVSLYLLRTEGQVYADYVQMAVSNVEYVINYRETANVDGVLEPDPVTTLYANKDANEIYLDLVTSFQQYKDRNSSSKKGWTFEQGDRLRFIYNPDGDLYDFIEVEIKEQRGNYFVIDNIDSLPELKQGFTVELFRLKTKIENKQYFEIAEHVKILNPYTDARAWETSTIKPNTGDAYRRNRKMIAKHEDETMLVTRIVEDPTPDDSVLEKDNDKGRSDFINYEYRQIRRLATGRYSDKLVPDSSINKLRRFDAEQQFSADANYGAITIVDDFTNVIFIAQENKCHTRLVSKRSLYIGDGNIGVSAPGTYLSDEPYYLNDEYGCKNPESYMKCKGFGVFYDVVNSTYVAYFNQNGLNSLSGYDDKYGSSKLQDSVFKDLSNRLALIPAELYKFLVQAQSVYSDDENEINISIRDIDISVGQDISEYSGYKFGSNIGENDVKFKVFDKSDFAMNFKGFTLCFDNESKMWLLNRDYNPTTYGQLNNLYIGFTGSDLHVMDAGDENSYNTFFGVKYKSRIDAIMNIEPSDLKFYTNWSVESNAKWQNPYVRVANSRAFREIESFTPDGKIVRRQGVFYAPFMFDTNTPNVANPVINGNKLVGETLLLRLENDDNTQVILYAINIYAGYLPRSNY